MPLLGNPAYKMVFNATLSSFPGAFLFLSSACFSVALLCNSFVYTQKGQLKNLEDSLQIEQELMEAYFRSNVAAEGSKSTNKNVLMQ